MGKKHKGNKVDGWVVIDRPVGVTSIKAVSKARWAFQAYRPDLSHSAQRGNLTVSHVDTVG